MYTLEAHASDTWPMKFSVEWRSPTTLEERGQHALACAVDMDILQLDTVEVVGAKQRLRDGAGDEALVVLEDGGSTAAPMEEDGADAEPPATVQAPQPPRVRVCVDHPVGDAFNTAFCAWPLAYYLIEPDGTLVYIGACPEGSASYDLRDLTSFVNRWVEDQHQQP